MEVAMESATAAASSVLSTQRRRHVRKNECERPVRCSYSRQTRMPPTAAPRLSSELRLDIPVQELKMLSSRSLRFITNDK